MSSRSLVAAFVIALLGLTAAFAVAQTPRSRCPGREVNINFVDAPLSDVLALVTKTTGRRFILSGDMGTTKISVFSPRPICPDEVDELLDSALAAQGLTLVKRGRFEVVTPTAKAVRSPIPVFIE